MTATSTFHIDLDAERREVQHPDGITVLLRGEMFLFPAELPADALDPLLSEELDLVGLLGEVIDSSGEISTAEVIDLFFRRASLPREFLAAVKEIYAVLLGSEEFRAFKAIRPSIGDYVRLTKALAQVYAVDLGKLFGLAGSSANAGATSSPTSPATTSSTPDASGSGQDSPDSSESAG
jgi:hypothetical protein